MQASILSGKWCYTAHNLSEFSHLCHDLIGSKYRVCTAMEHLQQVSGTVNQTWMGLLGYLCRNDTLGAGTKKFPGKKSFLISNWQLRNNCCQLKWNSFWGGEQQINWEIYLYYMVGFLTQILWPNCWCNKPPNSCINFYCIFALCTTAKKIYLDDVANWMDYFASLGQHWWDWLLFLPSNILFWSGCLENWSQLFKCSVWDILHDLLGNQPSECRLQILLIPLEKYRLFLELSFSSSMLPLLV